MFIPKEMMEDIVRGLIDIFGEKLDSIILYGSVARGDDVSESDFEKNTLDKWGNVVPFYKNIQSEGIVLWKAA